MNISEEMEQALLAYFAEDEGDERAFRSLTTIFEKVSRPSQWREAFFSDVDVVEDKEQLRAILDQMVIDGLLQRNWGDRDYESSYRATDEGVYESVLGLDGYIPQRPSIKPIEFDPESWTGSQSIFIDGKTWVDVRKTALELQARSRTTNYYSDIDQRDIQALADALVALCQMAEPELTLIDRITAHPKFKTYAALAVFVATIRGALGI